MEIIFLGTGTSQGVPVIGCDCPTCVSALPQNKRLRTSIYVTHENTSLIVDTAIDFRQQCLTHNIRDIDAVLFTHQHADHVFGLDDIRAFNFRLRKDIPCYGNPGTIADLKQVFSYIFAGTPGSGLPRVTFQVIKPEPLTLGDITVEPVEVLHGTLPVFAYKFGTFMYATDCSEIPEASIDKFLNLEVLVLDCLREKPHPTHFNLEQAIETIGRLKPRKAFLTHISHVLEHESTNRLLPENIRMAYDGLKINL